MTTELRNRIPANLFQNTTTSYKFFWAISLLELNKLTGREVFEMKYIIARMVSDAALVLDNNSIKLGGADHFRISLSGLRKLYPESFNAGNQLFESLAKDVNTNVIRKILGYYTENVPYRFLTPWIGTKFNRGDLSNGELMFELDAPYSVETRESDRVVRLNPSWITAVGGHEDELIGLIVDKLGEYIDHRNVDLSNDYLARIKSILFALDAGSLSSETVEAMIRAESVASPFVYRQKTPQPKPFPSRITTEPALKDAPPIIKDRRITSIPKLADEKKADEIVNGKVITVRDPKILNEILPLIETNKLDAISILYKHYEIVNGLEMSFLDWGNLIDRIRWDHISELAELKGKKTNAPISKTLTVASSTDKTPQPIAPKKSKRADMTEWRSLRRCLSGIRDVQAIFGNEVDFPEFVVLGLRVDSAVITLRCRAWSYKTKKRYIINLLFPSVTYYSASQLLSKEEFFEMGAQMKNGKIKYKIGSKIYINSGKARVLSIGEE